MKRGPGGWISGYDSGSAMQQMLASEQWDMQKDLLRKQIAASREGASGLQAMVGQYNTAYQEARAANEARYREMLGIADTTVDQRTADIRSAGASEKADIMQQLSRLGMAGTTVAPTLKRGVESETQKRIDRSKQQLAGMRIGVRERRTDEYPRSDIIMALAQALGSSPAGPGGIVKALSGMNLGSATS
jgi:hypothetical protein